MNETAKRSRTAPPRDVHIQLNSDGRPLSDTYNRDKLISAINGAVGDRVAVMAT